MLVLTEETLELIELEEAVTVVVTVETLAMDSSTPAAAIIITTTMMITATTVLWIPDPSVIFLKRDICPEPTVTWPCILKFHAFCAYSHGYSAPIVEA